MARNKFSYLSRLEFDQKLSSSFIAKYLGNIRIPFLLILVIIFIGVTSYINLPRRLNPEVNITFVSVSTVLPGSSPSDIESLITEPLEKSLNGIEGVRTISSSSQESLSLITIEFSSTVDQEKALADVKSAVETVNDLPEDANSPSVELFDLENLPIWEFALSRKDGDQASLYRYAESLQTELESLPEVETVSLSGFEEKEIVVTVSPEKISLYNINPLEIAGQLRSALGSYPGGNITTLQNSFALTLDPTITDINSLRDLKLDIAGNSVNISEIADISERSKINQKQSFITNPGDKTHNTVVFSIFKTNSANIDAASHAAKSEVEKALLQNPDFQSQSISDNAEEITHQSNELLREFTTTLILVFITLFIFLGFRQATISATTIPLTFLTTFAVMSVIDMSINFLSLFSLLLALGILVDDTIVVVTGITAYYRTKKFTTTQAALLVWRDYIIPVWTATLTTIWAFIPLLLSTGIIGEFIKPIPIVVSSALLSSTAIAIFITLPLMMIILRPNIPGRVKFASLIALAVILTLVFIAVTPKGPLMPLSVIAFIIILIAGYKVRQNLYALFHSKANFRLKNKIPASKIAYYSDNGLINMGKISKRYETLIYRILSSKSARIKTIIAVVVFSLLSYSLVPLGFVVNEFFPKVESNLVTVSVEMPSGTNYESTKKEALAILSDIDKKVPEKKFVITQVGSGQGSSSDNIFTHKIIIPDEKDRTINSIELSQKLREDFQNYNQGKLSVIEQSGGPPAGEDINIKILGDDLTLLDQYADQIVSYLENNPSVNNVSKSIRSGTGKISFIPDKQKLAENNLNEQTIGTWLRIYGSGLKLEDLKIGGTSREINFRISPENISPDVLGQIQIPNGNSQIPLSSLGKFQLEPNPTQINREDTKRVVSITAGVNQGFSVGQTNSDLEKFADSLELPEEYSWKTGGVNEENNRSVQSILQAMVISAILILATMILQLKSFRKALIVLLVIPLAISGVFIVFALTHTPLSFPALIGMLALFGIVVRNSMLLLDKINLNLKFSNNLKEVIADAAGHRLEPIFFTSLAAIVGLIPITISDPLWRGLGGAIIAGLTFSGTIMLMFIPVVYYMWFHKEEDHSEK